MKDEIKEILEEIKSYTEHEYLPPYCELAPQDCKILLDYITNLQKENEHLDKVNCHLRKKINNDNYKSRNEKAIEYIKNNIADIEFIKKQYGLIYDDYVETTIDNIEKLLNILQGEDNTPENLYKYTPEKGFRLAGDEDVKDKR